MAMSVEARAKVLFAAFLVLLAAAGAAWYLLDAHGFVLYEIRSRDNVSGLIPGAPVEFHGVEVGRVHEVELAGAQDVRVVLQVKKHAPVTTATVATIMGRGLATRGFTGYVYVNLENGAAAGQPLVAEAGSRYPRIASAPAQAVSLDTSINQLNESVESAVALLRSVLDAQTVTALKESLRSLDQVTKTLAANNARLAAIIGNAERASAQMPPLLQSSSEMVRTLEKQVLPEAQGTLARLNSLTASTNDTVRSLQTQVLPETQRAVTRLDQLSTSLNDTAERLRRDPSILLRGARAARPGPGESP